MPLAPLRHALKKMAQTPLIPNSKYPQATCKQENLHVSESRAKLT